MKDEKNGVNHYSTKPGATLPPDLQDKKTILIRFSYLQAKWSITIKTLALATVL